MELNRIGEGIFVVALWLIALPVLALCGDDTTGAIDSLLETNNPLRSDAEEVTRIGDAIDAAARSYNVPPLLLVAMAHHETRFLAHRIGRSHGERGILQVHGTARHNCNLETVEQQLDCGARWLRGRIDHCGSIEGGLTAYACGRCKAAKKSRCNKAVQRRLRLWRRLTDERLRRKRHEAVRPADGAEAPL